MGIIISFLKKLLESKCLCKENTIISDCCNYNEIKDNNFECDCCINSSQT